MRNIALFVALAMIVASPAMAAQKKAKKAEPKQPEMADWQKQNDNSYRLVRDSLPMWLPSWAQPVYQYGVKGVDTPPDTAKPAAKAKKSKKKS